MDIIPLSCNNRELCAPMYNETYDNGVWMRNSTKLAVFPSHTYIYYCP